MNSGIEMNLHPGSLGRIGHLTIALGSLLLLCSSESVQRHQNGARRTFVVPIRNRREGTKPLMMVPTEALRECMAS